MYALDRSDGREAGEALGTDPHVVAGEALMKDAHADVAGEEYDAGEADPKLVDPKLMLGEYPVAEEMPLV